MSKVLWGPVLPVGHRFVGGVLQEAEDYITAPTPEMRFSVGVAVSLLYGVGGKSTRERSIRRRSQRSN
jgi:hypothetical protein